MSFPLSYSPVLPWANTSTTAIAASVLSYTRFSVDLLVYNSNTSSMLTLLGVGLAWVGAIVMLLLHIGYVLYTHQRLLPWPVKVCGSSGDPPRALHRLTALTVVSPHLGLCPTTLSPYRCSVS